MSTINTDRQARNGNNGLGVDHAVRNSLKAVEIKAEYVPFLRAEIRRALEESLNNDLVGKAILAVEAYCSAHTQYNSNLPAMEKIRAVTSAIDQYLKAGDKTTALGEVVRACSAAEQVEAPLKQKIAQLAGSGAFGGDTSELSSVKDELHLRITALGASFNVDRLEREAIDAIDSMDWRKAREMVQSRVAANGGDLSKCYAEVIAGLAGYRSEQDAVANRIRSEEFLTQLELRGLAIRFLEHKSVGELSDRAQAAATTKVLGSRQSFLEREILAAIFDARPKSQYSSDLGDFGRREAVSASHEEFQRALSSLHSNSAELRISHEEINRFAYKVFETPEELVAVVESNMKVVRFESQQAALRKLGLELRDDLATLQGRLSNLSQVKNNDKATLIHMVERYLGGEIQVDLAQYIADGTVVTPKYEAIPRVVDEINKRIDEVNYRLKADGQRRSILSEYSQECENAGIALLLKELPADDINHHMSLLNGAGSFPSQVVGARISKVALESAKTDLPKPAEHSRDRASALTMVENQRLEDALLALGLSSRSEGFTVADCDSLERLLVVTSGALNGWLASVSGAEDSRFAESIVRTVLSRRPEWAKEEQEDVQGLFGALGEVVYNAVQLNSGDSDIGVQIAKAMANAIGGESFRGASAVAVTELKKIVDAISGIARDQELIELVTSGELIGEVTSVASIRGYLRKLENLAKQSHDDKDRPAVGGMDRDTLITNSCDALINSGLVDEGERAKLRNLAMIIHNGFKHNARLFSVLPNDYVEANSRVDDGFEDAVRLGERLGLLTSSAGTIVLKKVGEISNQYARQFRASLAHGQFV